jgi:endonuclease YncB( thermonuclease family)
MRRAFTLACLLCSFILPAHAGTLSSVGNDIWVKAAYVFDGDTFKTSDGVKVRLLGIDAPETAHGMEPGEPLGNSARRHLQALIEGELVRLDFDTEKRDIYGRLLAHVYLRDGDWVNASMVRYGLAMVYTFPPNLRHAAALARVERIARRQQKGIWKTPRFAVLTPKDVGTRHAGQFRLVRGTVTKLKKNGYDFRLGELNVSVPRKYRPYFPRPPGWQDGDRVVAHGTIRISRSGRLYLALHSPSDLEIIK